MSKLVHGTRLAGCAFKVYSRLGARFPESIRVVLPSFNAKVDLVKVNCEACAGLFKASIPP